MFSPEHSSEDFAEQLLEWRKLLEKQLIFSFVAIGASRKSNLQKEIVRETATDMKDVSNDSLLTISESLGESLTGEFGQKAQSLLKENIKKMK